MARQDDLTMELPGIKRRVGRPSTGKAKSGAKRQAQYRERVKALQQVDLSILEPITPSMASTIMKMDFSVFHGFLKKRARELLRGVTKTPGSGRKSPTKAEGINGESPSSLVGISSG